MFYLSDFCCICLCNGKDLQDVLVPDQNGVSVYTKLSTSLRGMVFTKINNRILICQECLSSVNFIYQFQRKCLTTGFRLRTYKTQLQCRGQIEGSLNVGVVDFVNSSAKPLNSVEQTNDLIKTEVIDQVETLSYFSERNIKTNMSIENSTSGLEAAEDSFRTIQTKIKTEVADLAVDTITKGMDMDDSQDLLNLEADNIGTEVQDEVSSRLVEIGVDNDIKEEPGDGQSQVEDLIVKEEDLFKESLDGFDTKPLPPDNYSLMPKMDKWDSPEFIDCGEPLRTLAPKPSETCLESQAGTCGDKPRHEKLEQSHIPNEGKSHSCDKCTKQFASLTRLFTHKLSHKDDYLRNCNICHKTFKHTGSLKRHILTHTGEKSHTCKVCGKSFTLKQTLQTHSMTHSEVKAYECSICMQKFRHSQSLKFHTLIHTGVKPHTCKVCGMEFNRKSTLNDHTVLHTGAQPFQCKTCGLKFTRRGLLRKHRNEHAEKKPTI